MLQGLGRISFMKGSAGMLENNASKRSWLPLVMYVPLKHLCDSGEAFEPWFNQNFLHLQLQLCTGKIRMSQKALRLSCTSFSGSVTLGTVIFISKHSPASWGADPGRAAGAPEPCQSLVQPKPRTAQMGLGSAAGSTAHSCHRYFRGAGFSGYFQQNVFTFGTLLQGFTEATSITRSWNHLM